MSINASFLGNSKERKGGRKKKKEEIQDNKQLQCEGYTMIQDRPRKRAVTWIQQCN